MQLSDYSWYAVMTKPRAEAAAAKNLRQKGYKTIYLHTSEWTAGTRRRKPVLLIRPHLRGYIFVGLERSQFAGGVPMFYEVNNSVGVSSVVRSPGSEPLAIPLKAMELITKEADLPSGLVMSNRPVPVFAGKPGFRVRLSGMNAYQGFISEILKVDPSGKITILIESFGRSVPATIGLEDIDKLFTPEGEPIDLCEPILPTGAVG